MLTIFSSIEDLFETSKTYGEKEKVGEKIELFSRRRRTFAMSSLFFRTVDVDLKVDDLSRLNISGSTSVVRFLC